MADTASGTVGLVLAGAGARGAFEAGAVARLLPELERQGRRPAVLCGTSAGAITAVLLAATAHLPADGAADELARQWCRAPASSMLRSLALAWPPNRLRWASARLGLPALPAWLLDPSVLRRLLGRFDGWAQLHRNVEAGVVDAVALAVSDLTSGRTVVHVETRPDRPLPADDEDRGIRYVRTRLDLAHLYASCAIPLLSVPVGLPDGTRTAWGVDGGVRLDVPLKPALDLGAERLVVVATDVTSRPQAVATAGAPGAADVLDALLHGGTGERLLEDLRTLTQVNALLEAAGDGGPVDRQGRPYRRVPALVVTPARAGDLARLAGGSGALADLATFLLFVAPFTQRAFDLGATRAAAVIDGAGDGWLT